MRPAPPGGCTRGEITACELGALHLGQACSGLQAVRGTQRLDTRAFSSWHLRDSPGRCCHCPHFTHVEITAQKRSSTCQGHPLPRSPGDRTRSGTVQAPRSESHSRTLWENEGSWTAPREHPYTLSCVRPHFLSQGAGGHEPAAGSSHFPNPPGTAQQLGAPAAPCLPLPRLHHLPRLLGWRILECGLRRLLNVPRVDKTKAGTASELRSFRVTRRTHRQGGEPWKTARPPAAVRGTAGDSLLGSRKGLRSGQEVPGRKQGQEARAGSA